MDMIVSNYMMPNMDGMQQIKALREEELDTQESSANRMS